MRKKEAINEIQTNALVGSRRDIISYKEMMGKLQKMRSKNNFLEIRFDPLGYLYVNGSDQTEPDDFLMYRKGTLYGSLNGTYHCSGKLDEHCRIVAAVHKQKLLAEREDDSYHFSSKKVPLPDTYCLLVFFKLGETLNLLVADGSVCKHVRVLSMEKSGDSKFILLNAFFALLNERDARLAALARGWYGRLNLGNFYSA